MSVISDLSGLAFQESSIRVVSDAFGHSYRFRERHRVRIHPSHGGQPSLGRQRPIVREYFHPILWALPQVPLRAKVADAGPPQSLQRAKVSRGTPPSLPRPTQPQLLQP